MDSHDDCIRIITSHRPLCFFGSQNLCTTIRCLHNEMCTTVTAEKESDGNEKKRNENGIKSLHSTNGRDGRINGKKTHFAGLRLRESESLSEKQGQREGNKSGEKIYEKKSFKFECGWIFAELYGLSVMALSRWLPATIAISAAKSIWETFAVEIWSFHCRRCHGHRVHSSSTGNNKTFSKIARKAIEKYQHHFYKGHETNRTRRKNGTNRRKENGKKWITWKCNFSRFFFRRMINNVIQLTCLQFIY